MFDILETAQRVCLTWRRICKDPMTWRTIRMEFDIQLSQQKIDDENFTSDKEKEHLRKFDYFNARKMCHHAIHLSFGNLVDISIKNCGTDELLEHMTDSSTGIRRLRLVCSYGISDEGLIEVASKLPQLEDLDITYCRNLSHRPVEVLGRSCPLLRSFKLNKEWRKYSDNSLDEIIDDEGRRSKDDEALAIAGTMHGLNHLQLFQNQLTNDGLKAILDGCPHLELLDLRSCFNLNLEGDLGRRCTEKIKRLFLPGDLIPGTSTDWPPGST
ncbi:PREDICTED: putative F-box/LRR-repeat protein 23-like [Fragaria vesca subsp. vesca]